MALHPEVQEKCQKEIDEVLGSKLPTIEDVNKLTYVMATLMEIQRYSLVAQGSLPHYLLSDTELRGYKFKKGTVFICNLEKFLNDPTEFPEPRHFKPDRFIGKDGNLRKSEYFVPFGVGKRICMGETLAKNELFIFFVRVFQRTKISCIEGKEPDANEFISGITRIPKAFSVNVDFRS